MRKYCIYLALLLSLIFVFVLRIKHADADIIVTTDKNKYQSGETIIVRIENRLLSHKLMFLPINLRLERYCDGKPRWIGRTVPVDNPLPCDNLPGLGCDEEKGCAKNFVEIFPGKAYEFTFDSKCLEKYGGKE
jgi:hypothetical protein